MIVCERVRGGFSLGNSPRYFFIKVLDTVKQMRTIRKQDEEEV